MVHMTKKSQATMLNVSLCDYSDAYILAEGRITFLEKEQMLQQLQQIEMINN